MSEIEVTFHDGFGRELARPTKDILLSVRDGATQTFSRGFVAGPRVTVPAEFHNSPRDAHVLLASLKGHRDAGFMPVTVTQSDTTPVSVMLIPRQPRFVFASFADVRNQHAGLSALLGRIFGADAAAGYEGLQEVARRPALACLLNIVEALDVMALSAQKHPSLVEYIDRLELATQFDWLRQDRFFAWVDADIEQALDGSPHLFKRAPKALHKGATSSYKQFGFGEANVQVTLHANDKGQSAGGMALIKAEFDVDYFRDEAAHLLLEVFPNTLKRFVLGADSSESLTDPAIAYGLRWIAARQPNAPAQIRPFAPAFGLNA